VWQTQWEETMQRSLFVCVSVLAISGCAAPQYAPPAATGPMTPTSYAAGSATNTTTAFDGTYTGASIANRSAHSALPSAGSGSTSCPNYPTPPPVTIANGLGQLDVLNLRFQGYVTPQGGLAMRSGVGQRFEGQIDPQFVLTGRVIGACVYDASWRRS
jgi:hypothetical protein